MESVKGLKMPPGNAAAKLAKVVIFGGAAVYGLTNSLFNVEGGHRAILFNRIGGLSEKVRRLGDDAWHPAWQAAAGARGDGAGLGFVCA